MNTHIAILKIFPGIRPELLESVIQTPGLKGVEFAKRFTKGNHAFVVCTHIDLSLIHI